MVAMTPVLPREDLLSLGWTRAWLGCDRADAETGFGDGSPDVVEDDVGDPRDGDRGDHLERGRGPQQRFHRLLVLERLGELGRILPVGVAGPGGQPFGQDLGAAR